MHLLYIYSQASIYLISINYLCTIYLLTINYQGTVGAIYMLSLLSFNYVNASYLRPMYYLCTIYLKSICHLCKSSVLSIYSLRTIYVLAIHPNICVNSAKHRCTICLQCENTSVLYLSTLCLLYT